MTVITQCAGVEILVENDVSEIGGEMCSVIDNHEPTSTLLDPFVVSGIEVIPVQYQPISIETASSGQGILQIRRGRMSFLQWNKLSPGGLDPPAQTLRVAGAQKD